MREYCYCSSEVYGMGKLEGNLVLSDPEKLASVIVDMVKGKNLVIGTSGFGSVGYPKTMPKYLAEEAFQKGVKVSILTGASAYAMDGIFAEKRVASRRYPYQNNPVMRKLINSGLVEFMDYHLGEWPFLVRYGWLDDVVGEIDLAIVEAAKVFENGFVPTGSVGAITAFVERAKYVVLEVNRDVSEEMNGIHDIYIPQPGEPIPIRKVEDRVGSPIVSLPKGKILGVVESSGIDVGGKPVEPGKVEKAIADNLLGFFEREVEKGRLPRTLYPLESGVGAVNDAVFKAVGEAGFKGLKAWTEVIQDSLLNMYLEGKMDALSATSLMLSPGNLESVYKEAEEIKKSIVLRPQDVTNNIELIRRLRVIAINTAVEVDILGNVNSTHILGKNMINGIGGSGDFSRGAFLSIFITPSIRKDGKISTIVPLVTHVDTVDHDVDVVVTDQGFCDLRGLSLRERARLIIEKCAHPIYRDQLWKYYKESIESGGHSPFNPEKAFSFHLNYIQSGDMRE
jgi:succinyl-CoA:acetate CoA-transferase